MDPTSAMETWTPGIGAPDSPRTVPVIDPPATCALSENGAANESHADKNAIRTHISFRRPKKIALSSLAQFTKMPLRFEFPVTHPMLPPNSDADHPDRHNSRDL